MTLAHLPNVTLFCKFSHVSHFFFLLMVFATLGTLRQFNFYLIRCYCSTIKIQLLYILLSAVIKEFFSLFQMPWVSTPARQQEAT